MLTVYKPTLDTIKKKVETPTFFQLGWGGVNNMSGL